MSGAPPPPALPAPRRSRPGRRTWGAAGLCLGQHAARDGSPLEVEPLSSRASAGRSRGEPRDPLLPPHNFPAVHLGLAERPGDFDAGLRATGGPRLGSPVGAGGWGDVPLAPSCSPRMAPPAE